MTDIAVFVVAVKTNVYNRCKELSEEGLQVVVQAADDEEFEFRRILFSKIEMIEFIDDLFAVGYVAFIQGVENADDFFNIYRFGVVR